MFTSRMKLKPGRWTLLTGCLLWLLAPGVAAALTMTGPLQVSSALHEPFAAEIPYILDPGEELPGVEVLVGVNSDFAGGGEARTRLTARLVETDPAAARGGATGRGGRIVITGTRPEVEPFFTILVRITKADISFVRNFVVVLDAFPTTGVAPVFPVRNGMTTPDALAQIAKEFSWNDWRGWLAGLPRELLAGISGVVALLLVLVLRWLRGSRSGEESEEASLRHGDGVHERVEPVAVSDEPLRDDGGEPEEETPEGLDSWAEEPAQAAFVVPALQPKLSRFAPDPLGEMPAPSPESLSEAEAAPPHQPEEFSRVEATPLATPQVSPEVEKESLEAFVAFAESDGEVEWLPDDNRPLTAQEVTEDLAEVAFQEIWSQTPAGEHEEAQDSLPLKTRQSAEDPEIEVVPFEFLSLKAEKKPAPPPPEAVWNPATVSNWEFVPFDTDPHVGQNGKKT
ncbi:MAG: hypothetical protein HQL95_15475 [Magnetococcales bacterium]|nr:hypothetical protein [Magnetococcales bacterium]